MALNYQKLNKTIEKRIIKWTNNVIEINRYKSDWDSSCNIHIDEIHPFFKKRWNWLNSSMYVFEYLKTGFVDLNKYQITLSIPLQKVEKEFDLLSIDNFKMIYKNMDKYTPPSFYIHLNNNDFLNKIVKDKNNYCIKNIKMYNGFMCSLNYADDNFVINYNCIELFHLS